MFIFLTFLGCPEIPDDTDGGGKGGPRDSGGGGDPVDADGDGYYAGDGKNGDCDDGDPEVHPGAVDICDGVDNDCDGDTDEDPDVTWHPDADGDGFGAEGEGVAACERPEGYGASASDCDDNTPDTFPGADELCDGEDNDCDGEIDEGLTGDEPSWADADGDGAGDPDRVSYGCGVPAGNVDNALDCDDRDASNPVWVESGGRGDGSMGDPFGSVQEALDSGVACVIAGPGNYHEDLWWPAQDVWLRSLYGPLDTYLTGTGAMPVVVATEGSTLESVIEGFTITGGGGYTRTTSGSDYVYTQSFGGGLLVLDGNGLTLVDSVVTGNTLPEYDDSTLDGIEYITASFGGGFYLGAGEMELYGTQVVENSAYAAGGIYVYGGGLTMSQSELSGNEALSWASLVADNGAVVTLGNVIVNANLPTSSPGGLAAYSSELILDHVDVLSHDYGLFLQSATVTLTNSILAGNSYGVYGYNSTLDASYNAFDNSGKNVSGVDDPIGTSGNEAMDCLFEDFNDNRVWDDDDLALSAGSPCIDAGSPRQTDADGSRADLGAYGGEGGVW